MLVFRLQGERMGGVGCEGFEQGRCTGAGLGNLFDTDTVLRIVMDVGEQNIRESVDGRDGVVQVMNELRPTGMLVPIAVDCQVRAKARSIAR